MSPHLPISRRLSPTSNTGIWNPAKRRVPGTAPFPLFPLSSRLCLQATEALVTREEPGRPGRASSSRLPGSPLPPPLAGESRASGRLQPCQSRPQPPQLTGLAGKAPRPQKARHQGFPHCCSTRKVGVPGRIFPPQDKPAVAGCKNEPPAIVTALGDNDFYPHICTQGSQLPRPP